MILTKENVNKFRKECRLGKDILMGSMDFKTISDFYKNQNISTYINSSVYAVPTEDDIRNICKSVLDKVTSLQVGEEGRSVKAREDSFLAELRYKKVDSILTLEFRHYRNLAPNELKSYNLNL